MALGSKLAVFAAGIVFTGITFANQATCPTLSQIQNQGLSVVSILTSNYYVAYEYGSYNTTSQWSFGMIPINATSSADALTAANAILSGMTSPGVVVKSGIITICSYNTGNPHIYAYAESAGTLSGIKQYYNETH